MATRRTPPELKAVEEAISKAARRAMQDYMFETKTEQREIAARMGVNQVWLSRHFNCQQPWRANELLALMNIIDADIAQVMAAGTAAMVEARKTNLCLSENDTVVAERNLGLWAQRGYNIAKGLISTMLTIDPDVKAA